ncbi:WD repeat protein [Ichthyophthirius multifiliis]|uniref:WD repeat protein n=1 Tax=Ichthyophthirius multifiliis TaxID=5932 RepID=G0QZL9_ICHMU|nr:WD repeat protein [Ichthyophthirius multifiliis]EGR29339.1 WD repeat protein [Ichthyophthirius multifiliis]|eukprot:XP_004030575.1 WD repeat protein [Ichthyophthirius multifiliis]
MLIERLAAIILDTQPIRTASFNQTGEYFVLGTNSRSIKAYSIDDIFNNYKQDQPPQVLWEKQNHHPGSIYTIDWSKNGELISTGSNDFEIKVIKAPKYPFQNIDFCTQKLIGPKGIVRKLKFLPCSTKLMSAGSANTDILYWDIQKSSLLTQFKGHQEAINSFDVFFILFYLKIKKRLILMVILLFLQAKIVVLIYGIFKVKKQQIRLILIVKNSEVQIIFLFKKMGHCLLQGILMALLLFGIQEIQKNIYKALMFIQMNVDLVNLIILESIQSVVHLIKLFVFIIQMKAGQKIVLKIIQIELFQVLFILIIN